MSEHGLDHALGNGWLTAVLSLVTGVVGAVCAWLAKRPIQKAGVEHVVNERVEILIKGQDAAIVRIAHQLEECERSHVDKDKKIEILEGRVDQLSGEVREGQALISALRRREAKRRPARHGGKAKTKGGAPCP